MSLSYIKSCFKRAKSQGASHMIMVVDTFNYEDYPVFVMPWEDVQKRVNEMNSKNMQKVMEVYDVSLGWDRQSQGKVFNF
jgi:hypothetical protein